MSEHQHTSDFNGVKVGSLISFLYNPKANFGQRQYVEVTGFYDILESHGGGKGVHYKILNGSGNGSTPESMITDVKIYNSIPEMQKEVDTNEAAEKFYR